MHPVGPEDVRTYWIRRGGAIAVLLVLTLGLGLFISNLGGTDGNATPPETTAVPAAVEEPATTQPPAPPPASPGSGVPNEVTNEEAVPIPSSARTATASESANPGNERTPGSPNRFGQSNSDVAGPQESTPEPEPANTFHLTSPATPSPTR